MKSLTSALREHFQGNLTTLATCWRITRKDGSILGFTDHDRPLTIDDIKYEASSGYYRTAISNSATTSVDNLEVQGFLDDDRIAESELRNGAYDFAEVEIFAVNWNDLSQGICRLRYGYFGEVTVRSSGQFVVELRGLMQLFSQTVGETITPECRADLGDERCRVKLVPDKRSNGKFYEEGTRVIVADDEEKRSVHLPLQNPQFDEIDSDEYYDWELSEAVVSNNPERPASGEYFVKPTSHEGYIRRFIPVVPEEDFIEIDAGYSVLSLDSDWEVNTIVELIESEGILGLVLTVLATYESGYQGIGSPSNWSSRNTSFNSIEVPSGCNSYRITIRWRPRSTHPEYPSPSESAQLYLDNITFSVSDTGAFDDEQMNFALAMAHTVDGIVGWQGNGDTHFGNHNLMPTNGSAFLTFSSTSLFPSVSQTISLTDTGISFTEIDDGNYVLNLVARTGAFYWGSASRIVIEFLDNSSVAIDTYDTGEQAIRPAGEWLERAIDVSVPPLTRNVRVTLDSGLTEERSGDGTNTSTSYDYINGELNHIDDNEVDYHQYGGVEYIALNEGFSSNSQPSFSRDLGTEIDDNGVTWECVRPQYTFLGTVDEVESNSEFTVPDINVEDDFFKWGVLTFLDGANRLRGVEILSWDNSTKTMTLMLPVLLPIEEGTTIRVHAGCDKSRNEGGCRKFDNILNFRGEPEVPGTDHYFKVGGTGR